MFINVAQAAAEAGNQTAGIVQSEGMQMLIQFVLIILIFYFLLLRPQQKKMKEQMAMLDSIAVGDDVVVGGLVGSVKEILNEKEIMVEFSDKNAVKVIRGYVSQVMKKDK